jgi:hypothetical protein
LTRAAQPARVQKVKNISERLLLQMCTAEANERCFSTSIVLIKFKHNSGYLKPQRFSLTPIKAHE